MSESTKVIEMMLTELQAQRKKTEELQAQLVETQKKLESAGSQSNSNMTQALSQIKEIQNQEQQLSQGLEDKIKLASSMLLKYSKVVGFT